MLHWGTHLGKLEPAVLTAACDCFEMSCCTCLQHCDNTKQTCWYRVFVRYELLSCMAVISWSDSCCLAALLLRLVVVDFTTDIQLRMSS